MKQHTKTVVRLLKQQFGRENVRTGAEIGVWEGNMSAHLLREFPNLDLLLVDPWDNAQGYDRKKPVELREARETAKTNVRFAGSRAIIRQLHSEEAAARVQDHTLDFVFIDANHKYEYVADDIRLWAPKLHPEGVLCGHDYAGRNDRRGIWGVKKAVDEFAAETDLHVHTSGLVWWLSKEPEEEQEDE